MNPFLCVGKETKKKTIERRKQEKRKKNIRKRRKLFFFLHFLKIYLLGMVEGKMMTFK